MLLFIEHLDTEKDKLNKGLSEKAKKFQAFDQAKYVVEVDDTNEEDKGPEIGVHPDFVQIQEVKEAVDNINTVLEKYNIDDEK